MDRVNSRKYGPLSDSSRAPSPPPRRAFSLPAMLTGGRGRGPRILSQLLPLSTPSRPSSPKATSSTPSRNLKRLSYTLRNRVSHNKLRVLVGSLLLVALFLWVNASARTHPVGRRLRSRSHQTVFDSSGKSLSGGVSFLDVEDADEWIAEDDLFFSQYTEDAPISPEDAAAEAEMASRKADVVEQNRQQSLRALTWWLAEGGEIPPDWEVPSKAYLKKVGGRGVERMLEDIEDVALGDDPVFEEGWEDFAKKRYRIVVFSKSFCPYSRRAKDVLAEYHLSPAPFVVELDARPDMAEIQTLLQHLTGRRTVPNILLDFASIGGSDDLLLLHSEGTLQRRFEEMGALPGFRRYQPITPQIPLPPPPPVPHVAPPLDAQQGVGAGAPVAAVPAGMLDVVTPEKLGYAAPPEAAKQPAVPVGKAAFAEPFDSDAGEQGDTEVEGDEADSGNNEDEEQEEQEEEEEEEEEEEKEPSFDSPAPANVFDRDVRAAVGKPDQPNAVPPAPHVVAKVKQPKAVPAAPRVITGDKPALKQGADPADIRAAVQAAHGNAYLHQDADGDLDEVEPRAPFGGAGDRDDQGDDTDEPEDEDEYYEDDAEEGEYEEDDIDEDTAAGADVPIPPVVAAVPPAKAPVAPVKAAAAAVDPGKKVALKGQAPVAAPAQAPAAKAAKKVDNAIQQAVAKPAAVPAPAPAAAKKADSKPDPLVAAVKIDPKVPAGAVPKPAAAPAGAGEPDAAAAAAAGGDARARAKAKVAAAKARNAAAGPAGAQAGGKKVDTLLERANAAAQAKRKAIQEARARAKARKAAAAGVPVGDKKDAKAQAPVEVKKAAPAVPVPPVQKKAEQAVQNQQQLPAQGAAAAAQAGGGAGQKAMHGKADTKDNHKVAPAPIDANRAILNGKKAAPVPPRVVDNGKPVQAQAPVVAKQAVGAGGAGAGAGAAAKDKVAVPAGAGGKPAPAAAVPNANADANGKAKPKARGRAGAGKARQAKVQAQGKAPAGRRKGRVL